MGSPWRVNRVILDLVAGTGCDIMGIYDKNFKIHQ